MKISLWGLCSLALLFPSSQEPFPTQERKLSFGASPSWVLGDKPALIEVSGPVAGVGPLSSSLFPQNDSQARKIYLLAPTEKSESSSVKLALQAPWRLLLLPPASGDSLRREITVRGVDLEWREEPVKMESHCGSCGHHGPAIFAETAKGTVYLPFQAGKEAPAPPPSRVRFQ